MPVDTLEKFLARCSYMLRQDMDKVTDPEGDVPPSLFHYHEGESVRQMPLPPHAFASRESKDRLIYALSLGMRAITPKYVAFQSTGYAVALDFSTLSSNERQMALEANAWPESVPAAKDHPDRYELLSIVAMDGERYLRVDARIERDGVNPPVYGPWVEGSEASGAMVTPLQDVLREARIG
jgi:hypothetical protein